MTEGERIYNKLRRRKEIQKVTPIDKENYPDELINRKIEIDTRPVLFQIDVDLDSFLYTIPKNRYNFLQTEEEQILGKGYSQWTVEERKGFLWKIRYEAKLISSHSPDPNQWNCFPDEVLTEVEKSYVRRKKLEKITLEDLERKGKKDRSEK